MSKYVECAAYFFNRVTAQTKNGETTRRPVYLEFAEWEMDLGHTVAHYKGKITDKYNTTVKGDEVRAYIISVPESKADLLHSALASKSKRALPLQDFTICQPD